MAKERLAIAEMLMNLVLGRPEEASRVTFFPQKPQFPLDEPYEQPFSRATPESQGISSAYLADLVRSLRDAKGVTMHHLMILRHGNVICECNFAPYQGGIWHITHSMCKSITGMAIGMLIEEGLLSLDENIYRIFEDRSSALMKIFRQEVTVEHLLTMTSGVQFNESGAVSGNDWLTSFLNAPQMERPGTVFHYNSMNTYVLSAIVTKRTGLRLDEYLKPRLFEPLGITKYFWETCPMGITKGGWGLFLAAEDMAKLGQLYLQHGRWGEQQLVPEHWVASSTAKHNESGEDTFGYGYQLWMEERPGSYEFNGMLGQNVIVYPDLDMVVVTNAANHELFQNCGMLDIIRSYFPMDYTPSDGACPEDPAAYRRLCRICEETEKGIRQTVIRSGGWKKGKTVRKQAGQSSVLAKLRELDGRQYELEQKNVGLFPLLMQVFHNNMTSGISHLAFSKEQDGFYVLFRENGEWHPLKVGFGRAETGTLVLHEEPYLVAVTGAFTKDEDERLVLKLELDFLEEAAKRQVRMFFDGDAVELRWYEVPGKRMIMQGINSVTEDLSGNLLFGMLKETDGIEEILGRLMRETVEPVVYGVRITDLLAEDETKETGSIDSDVCINIGRDCDRP